MRLTKGKISQVIRAIMAGVPIVNNESAVTDLIQELARGQLPHWFVGTPPQILKEYLDTRHIYSSDIGISCSVSVYNITKAGWKQP